MRAQKELKERIQHASASLIERAHLETGLENTKAQLKIKDEITRKTTLTEYEVLRSKILISPLS